MGKRKFGPKDWAVIKYGEYAGCRAKVVLLEKNGDYGVIPYGKDNEPGGMLMLNARSLDKLPPLEISGDELKALARAEKMYDDYKDSVFPPFNIRAAGDYELTAVDIRDALININSRNRIYSDKQIAKPVWADIPQGGDDELPRNCLKEFKEWFWVIMNVFYDHLNIAGRYDPDFFSDAPENADEIFSVAYGMAEKLYWRLEERFGQKEDIEKFVIKFEDPLPWDKLKTVKNVEEIGYKFVCDDLISRVDTFLKNMTLPREEWEYSLSAKRHIVTSYDNENNLKDATPEAREMYRAFVEDLYNAGDVQALKILAWGHYEGNEVYNQDWFLSEKYLTELFKKTGDPYAANSLGYIYYYGRTSFDLKPDYVRAFRYFSYGVLAGIDESIYKTGDMLIAGKGTVKNLDMGLNLIVDGYRNAMNDFCDGNFGCHLADYALRMGNACCDDLIYGMNIRDAYKFYLEAKFAIRKRRETHAHYGDDAVEARIDYKINKIREMMNLGDGVTSVKTDFPLYISQLFDDKFPLKVSIKLDKDGKNGTMKISRFRLGGDLAEKGIIPEESEIYKLTQPSKILVAYPELSYAELVSEITYRLEGIVIVRQNEKGPFFMADGFRKNEKTNALEFFANGQMTAAIDAQWFEVIVNKK